MISWFGRFWTRGGMEGAPRKSVTASSARSFWEHTQYLIVGEGTPLFAITHLEWDVKDVFEGICFRDQPCVMMQKIVVQLLVGEYLLLAYFVNEAVPILRTCKCSSEAVTFP